ncbi:hypothetical protein CMO83_03945 [Candidatus Woesearchaeota archaeon]|jgi:branched-chain amino acid transport system substrate-binding protein|nr:hypothetical protein [Candidatus Woesearchaeota archaeon]MAG91802.1 hypothetical protein [Candidatus Woesearchaeota archaeon]|tara:strand:+ start:11556 stop:12710 length:1155 start_codon:yes stop_codon:yes gene_type:complete
MKRTLLGFMIFIVLILGACQIVQQPIGEEEAEEEVELQGSYKIGVIYPLSGDAASYGLPIQRTTKIAVDEINAKGGVNGRKLQIIYEDGKCNPKDGNAGAQKLVDVDKVQVIIGGVCSGETLGAAPITEAGRVILISPSATSPDVTDAGDFVFRTAPSDAFAGVVAAEYAISELAAEKAAVITEATDYAQGLREVFNDNFAELGGEIVSDETFNPEDTDFRTQVTKVKAAKPDVIYIVPQSEQKGVLLVRQIKEAGLTQQLITAEVLIGRNLIAENEELEGIIGVEQRFDEDAPKASALLAKYKEQANQDAPFPAYMSGSYDIVYLIAEAIEAVGYDGEKIRDYLYGVEDFEGALGKITFDERGDVLLDFAVRQAKDGKIETLK